MGCCGSKTAIAEGPTRSEWTSAHDAKCILGMMSESSNLLTDQVEIVQRFPMKVMKISTFIECGRIMKYEEAEVANLLEAFGLGMVVVFVSHMWLQRFLPDSTDHIKYRMLSEFFKLATKDDVTIPPYWLGELYQTATSIEMKSLAQAYIWMDYTCVPQENPVVQANAINSIVTYVDAATYFIALAPVAQHWTGSPHDLSLWKSRGWCRMERLVNALSAHPKQTVVINSLSSIYVSFSHDWLFEPVGEGIFTVEADRTPLGKVLSTLIRRAKERALEAGDVRRFRQLDCMTLSILKGLPIYNDLEAKLKLEGFHDWMLRMGFKSATDGEQSGWSPLRYAMYQGRLDFAGELIARGADINAPLTEVDSTFGYHMPGCTIMHGLAYARDIPEGIRLLVAHKADAMGRQSAGLTPIMLAAHGVRIGNFKALAEISPELLGTGCHHGAIPLNYAVCTGSKELFALANELTICSVGFDPKWHNGLGLGIVAIALAHVFDPATLQMAINAGYDLNWAGSDENMTPDCREAVASMAKACEASEKPTELQQLFGMLSGSTALMFAAHFGNVTATRILLDAGASVDERNGQGRTALILACMRGHHEVVKILLEAGAAKDVADYRGRTAADWAFAHNHEHTADMVRKWDLPVQ